MDILPAMSPDRARQLLAAERERIERELAKLERDASQEAEGQSEPGEYDSEDLYEEELDTGLAETISQQLAAVERAEARLAEGVYGLSIDSGEPIPDERLEAMPTAERTIAEQERLGRG
jgi:DnaK suppressor protein